MRGLGTSCKNDKLGPKSKSNDKSFKKIGEASQKDGNSQSEECRHQKPSTMSNIRAPRFGTEGTEKGEVVEPEPGKKKLLVYAKGFLTVSLADETEKGIVTSNRIGLSMEGVHSLRTLYVDWPKSGVQGILDNVLPKEYRIAAMKNEHIGEALLEILREWESNDLASNPPFKQISTDFDANLAGMVGYPIPSTLSVLGLPAPVNLKSVQLAVQENIVIAILLLLFQYVPARTGSAVITDLYRTLRDPQSVDGLTFIGQWYYGCIRENIILPRFGTIEDFIKLVIRLRKTSTGYGLLLVSHTHRLDIDMVMNILPDEHGLHHMMEMIEILRGRALSPLSYLFPHMMNFLDLGTPMMWSRDDCNTAHDILKTYDVNGIIDTV